jgi:hypothetical protein
LLAFASSGQKPIIIKGKIDNCSDRQTSYIERQWYNIKTLREETQRIDFSIEENGTFRAIITQPNTWYSRYWIHLGREYTHLDLLPGDSIFMTLNGMWFDESIKYTGLGAGRNNYRRDVFLEFWDRNANSRIMDESDPGNFLNALNALTDRKMELLNKYLISSDVDSSYYNVEKTMIANDKVLQLLNHNARYRNHQNATGSIASQLNSILNAADFSNNEMLHHSSFRELISRVPRYNAELNSRKLKNDLKSEIAYANSHYTSEMNLYFDFVTIRNYLNNAHSQSEKRALLSFFDEQFQHPELKREIQRQRGYLKYRMNNGLMEAIVATLAFFVGLIVLLFIVIKLLKITSFKRVQFDLAPWLKVCFYLTVSFFALLYIGHNHSHIKTFVGILFWLGLFIAHTYILIPKFALIRDHSRYFQILVATFIITLGGLYLCEPQLSLIKLVLIGSEIFGGIILISWASYYIDRLVRQKTNLQELIKSGDLNLELAFNLGVVLVLNFVFIAGAGNSRSILYQAIPFYSVIALFYFHTFISFPRFFSKGKALHFAGINVLILLLVSVVMVVFDGFQSQSALKLLGINKSLFDLFSIKNIRYDFLILFASLLVPSFVYYNIKERFKNLDTTGFSLYRKKEAELAQLRSQVNPHFLFNTLNTLYAFALKEGSEKTAECIAKLANLMRFMLDDMEKESILLQREVSYIEDYVKLQSIRSAVDHDISITVDIDEEQGYSIAPMLLIPFVENAFKHGMNPNKVSQLKIDITAKAEKIQFVIENSVDDQFEAYYKEKGFGIGIENVKSRLKHIYPDRHNISIARASNKFIVILTIDIL